MLSPPDVLSVVEAVISSVRRRGSRDRKVERERSREGEAVEGLQINTSSLATRSAVRNRTSDTLGRNRLVQSKGAARTGSV